MQIYNPAEAEIRFAAKIKTGALLDIAEPCPSVTSSRGTSDIFFHFANERGGVPRRLRCTFNTFSGNTVCPWQYFTRENNSISINVSLEKCYAYRRPRGRFSTSLPRYKRVRDHIRLIDNAFASPEGDRVLPRRVIFPYQISRVSPFRYTNISRLSPRSVFSLHITVR